jgi:dTMP kinase
MAGKLLIFEGPDGVGKSTIVKELRLRLPAEDFEFLSFPGRDGGTLGKVIYQIHHKPEEFGIKSMSELARQTLHIAAHIDVIEARLRPWLSQGKNVVLDRFWWSTLVYGSAGGGAQEALVKLVAAEEAVWGDIKPTVAFLVDRDAPIDRGDDLTYWQALRRGYAELSVREGAKYNVQILRNTGSIADAVEVAASGIKEALGT